MKRRRPPREKKELAYARDTRVVAEYPKAYRVAKPAKKRAAAHKERRRTDRLLADAVSRHVEEELTPASLRPRGRRKIANLTERLGVVVKGKLEARTRRIGTAKHRKECLRQWAEFEEAMHDQGEVFGNLSTSCTWCTGNHGSTGFAIEVAGPVPSRGALGALRDLAVRYETESVHIDLTGVTIVHVEAPGSRRK